MSKTFSLISILLAVKSAIKNTRKKPGPNAEIYGPRSEYEYGFLRTARRPIRMRDSSKPYNKPCLLDGSCNFTAVAEI